MTSYKKITFLKEDNTVWVEEIWKTKDATIIILEGKSNLDTSKQVNKILKSIGCYKIGKTKKPDEKDEIDLRNDRWYLNSGTISHHMTNWREWFGA